MKIYTSAQMKQIEANANEKGYAYIDMMHVWLKRRGVKLFEEL